MIGNQVYATTDVWRWAAALQQPHAAPTDTIVVQSPLPGGVATVIRFLLNTVPAWIQIGGVVVGAVVGAYVLWYLFRHRAAILGWLVTRSRGAKIALGVVAGICVLAGVGGGAVAYDYTEHANAFCTGCHVMNPAFERFSSAENKHAKLSCHSCHQQSKLASMRQLYLWVAERPEKIGKHAKVPNEVCKGCHVTGDTARWQRIASTAGHRVHLQSDSSALKNVQCVTCHGVEVHRFKPVNATCGQAGCHTTAQTTIVLGKMADQTTLHCTGCHAFTAPVPDLATRDSARSTLIPGMEQCLGCHEMQKVLATFDVRKDPHGGKCGLCHHPHEQKTPRAALSSCTDVGCHANWRDTPFHAGTNHQKVASQCLTCHTPHQAKLDPSDCQGCHTRVREQGKLKPPVAFDTTKALGRGKSSAPQLDPPRPEPDDAATPFAADDGDQAAPAAFDGADAVAVEASLGVNASLPPPSAADSMPHARHAKIACLVCHQTGSGHGRLTFEPPRGCAICHHQEANLGKCLTCHETEKYGSPKPVTVTVTVANHAPRPRTVNFLHSWHKSKACTDCHTTPVTLEPPASKVQCQDCHSDHHAAGRACSVCHQIADPRVEHKPLEAAHQQCDACHTASTIAQLVPTRSLCSTCHASKAATHYPQKECTVCHFLADPATYRAKLLTRPPQ